MNRTISSISVIAICVGLTACVAANPKPAAQPEKPKETKVADTVSTAPKYQDCFSPEFLGGMRTESYRSETRLMVYGMVGSDPDGKPSAVPECEFILTRPRQDNKGPMISTHKSPNGSQSWYVFGKCAATVTSRDGTITTTEYERMFQVHRGNDGYELSCESDQPDLPLNRIRTADECRGYMHRRGKAFDSLGEKHWVDGVCTP